MKPFSCPKSNSKTRPGVSKVEKWILAKIQNGCQGFGLASNFWGQKTKVSHYLKTQLDCKISSHFNQKWPSYGHLSNFHNFNKKIDMSLISSKMPSFLRPLLIFGKSLWTFLSIHLVHVTKRWYDEVCINFGIFICLLESNNPERAHCAPPRDLSAFLPPMTNWVKQEKFALFHKKILFLVSK